MSITAYLHTHHPTGSLKTNGNLKSWAHDAKTALSPPFHKRRVRIELASSLASNLSLRAAYNKSDAQSKFWRAEAIDRQDLADGHKVPYNSAPCYDTHARKKSYSRVEYQLAAILRLYAARLWAKEGKYDLASMDAGAAAKHLRDAGKPSRLPIHSLNSSHASALKSQYDAIFRKDRFQGFLSADSYADSCRAFINAGEFDKALEVGEKAAQKYVSLRMVHKAVELWKELAEAAEKTGRNMDAARLYYKMSEHTRSDSEANALREKSESLTDRFVHDHLPLADSFWKPGDGPPYSFFQLFPELESISSKRTP